MARLRQVIMKCRWVLVRMNLICYESEKLKLAGFFPIIHITYCLLWCFWGPYAEGIVLNDEKKPHCLIENLTKSQHGIQMPAVHKSHSAVGNSSKVYIHCCR